MSRVYGTSVLGESIAEFIGTFLLIFLGTSCVASLVLTGADYGQWGVSITWGFVVALAVYITGGVSGAHINPAVTITLATFQGFEKRKVIPYISAQLLGAFAGAAMTYGLFCSLFTDFELARNFERSSVEALATAGVFSTYPHPSLSFFGAFAVEVVGSFLLMFGILALSDDHNGVPRGHMGPFLVGILVAVIGATIGPLTGFAINPARDFGPKLFAWLAGWDYALSGGKDIPYFIVPLLAPIVGCLLGGWAYPALIAPHLPQKPPAEYQ